MSYFVALDPGNECTDVTFPVIIKGDKLEKG